MKNEKPLATHVNQKYKQSFVNKRVKFIQLYFILQDFTVCAQRKINEQYWLGNTGIDPIDTIIKNIVKYSYAHHIERLMYLGNWFLINGKHPKEVHRIFMEWTIDAYDWVMVP